MSSGEGYPSMPVDIDPQQMCGDVAPDMVGSDWYASNSYAFNDPYITPYPSSTIESHPWTQHARASIPNTSLYPYDSDPTQLPPHPSPSRLTSDRPQSSPSTFGPFPETIQWSMPNALGIHYSTPSGQPTPVTSTFPPSVFQQTYPQNQNLPQGPYRNSSPLAHELHQPQPRRTFHPLAPHPPPTHKRPYDGLSASNPGSDQGETTTPLPKRRRTSSTTSTKTTKTTGTGTGTEPTPLSPDDRFLVHLKEEAALPWKDIAARFSHERGGGGSRTYTVAALQMRYKRLKERVRVWEMRDLEALRAAHEFWERGRWEIIAYKMLDFGLSERWPARLCARKWAELEATAMAQSNAASASAGWTPGLSQLSSPVEGPLHFTFMPLQ